MESSVDVMVGADAGAVIPTIAGSQEGNINLLAQRHRFPGADNTDAKFDQAKNNVSGAAYYYDYEITRTDTQRAREGNTGRTFSSLEESLAKIL